MADVQRSPFDLRSWQGLTAVLKAARESSLSPDAYAEFRNLVLEYAQKGGDTELKKKIDAIIVTFGTPHEKKVSEKYVPTEPPVPEHKPLEHSVQRRLTPTFTVQKSEVPAKDNPVVVKDVVTPEPVVSIGREEVHTEAPSEVVAENTVPQEVSPQAKPPSPESFKTLEENRARILEIKHRVNTLVGNPVTLMDRGNTIGRTYMSALLGAMKATSPGSTTNVNDAMKKLEAVFLEILSLGETPQSVQNATVEETTAPAADILPVDTVEESVPSEPIPTIKADEPEMVVVPPPEEVVTAREITEPEPESKPEPEPVREVEMPIAETVPEDTVMDIPRAKPADERWLEDDQNDTKRAVRDAISEIKEGNIPTRAVERGRRSFLPSLVDIEEAPVNVPSGTQETSWHAHTVQDELSSESLMRRPESTVTGLTLGTPQTELMSQPVTASLVQLLHEWNIFASSGLFGMGPGGIDHPVYQQLSHLAMGEVLSGRWDNANPKIAHAIKDYVDAWRHEQGIAYNPTETFEHYLRRVAQRILKRQSGEA